MMSLLMKGLMMITARGLMLIAAFVIGSMTLSAVFSATDVYPIWLTALGFGAAAGLGKLAIDPHGVIV